MAKATALDKVRRVRQRPKPEPQSAPIGPDGPKHPGNRQLYDKRGRPDAGARLYADYPNPKVATFCAAFWLTFTLPLTHISHILQLYVPPIAALSDLHRDQADGNRGGRTAS